MADWGWVTPRVAVGSEPSRADLAAMRRAGITDVLDLRGEPRANERPTPELYAGTGLRYHYVGMLDRGGREPPEKYVAGVQIVLDALARDPAAKTLVHCAAGVSRSPSMVYAYLRASGMSREAAWSAVLRARPVASDQYVLWAEQAVPFLPRRAQKPVPLALVLGIGAATAAAYWLWSAPPPARR